MHCNRWPGINNRTGLDGPILVVLLGLTAGEFYSVDRHLRRDFPGTKGSGPSWMRTRDPSVMSRGGADWQGLDFDLAWVP